MIEIEKVSKSVSIFVSSLSVFAELKEASRQSKRSGISFQILFGVFARLRKGRFIPDEKLYFPETQREKLFYVVSVSISTSRPRSFERGSKQATTTTFFGTNNYCIYSSIVSLADYEQENLLRFWWPSCSHS